MAYVPGFTWDLFISYPMEVESWTKQFEADLRDETELTPAKGLKIYFAPTSWQQGAISDEMLEAARSSAVFVAILTRDALPDDETRFLQKEMEAFREFGPLKGRFFRSRCIQSTDRDCRERCRSTIRRVSGIRT